MLIFEAHFLGGQPFTVDDILRGKCDTRHLNATALEASVEAEEGEAEKQRALSFYRKSASKD